MDDRDESREVKIANAIPPAIPFWTRRGNLAEQTQHAATAVLAISKALELIPRTPDEIYIADPRERFEASFFCADRWGVDGRALVAEMGDALQDIAVVYASTAGARLWRQIVDKSHGVGDFKYPVIVTRSRGERVSTRQIRAEYEMARDRYVRQVLDEQSAETRQAATTETTTTETKTTKKARAPKTKGDRDGV